MTLVEQHWLLKSIDFDDIPHRVRTARLADGRVFGDVARLHGCKVDSDTTAEFNQAWEMYRDLALGRGDLDKLAQCEAVLMVLRSTRLSQIAVYVVSDRSESGWAGDYEILYAADSAEIYVTTVSHAGPAEVVTVVKPPRPGLLRDLTDPRWMWVKVAGFLAIAGICATHLWVASPVWTTAVFLFCLVYACCRAYYFAFYVIQHYIDPGSNVDGLWEAVRWVLRKRRAAGGQAQRDESDGQ